MNNETFQQAKKSYAERDYGRALGLFTECLQDAYQPPAVGEVGLLYHQIGNCLVRCKNYNEAIQAYSHAIQDTGYDANGVVNYNLGNTYATLKDFDNAVRHYEAAVADARYATPYKAHAAMGTALLKVGKTAEAGVAFREAALDEHNPDPTKSLLNLGICFMALDRPLDAIASYESSLSFNMTEDTKHKLMANLGQAYVATGQMKKAVGAFEKAIEGGVYRLNDSAAVDYQKAVGAVSQGTDNFSPVVVDLAAQADSFNRPPVEDMSGLDTLAAEGTAMLDPVVYNPPVEEQNYYNQPYGANPAYGTGRPLPPASDAFLAPTADDRDQWQQNFQMTGKKKKRTGLKIFLTLLIILVLVAAAGVFAYTQGFGYPMQEQVVQKLFADPNAAKTEVFAQDLSDAKIQSMIDAMATGSNVTVDGVERGMQESVAYATVTTAEGGKAQYKIVLSRDGIGWKVADVQLYFNSQN